ncbi:MAG: hypothetical protein ACOZCP_13925 [Pseudomonadota bacterium]|jgi:hypothetical protein
MDIDTVTARFCERHGLAMPEDIDALVDLHIRAIESWLDELTVSRY